MKSLPFLLALILLATVIASRELRSCSSCGKECQNACGTRNFKTCCFNYMKKRSDVTDPLELDPSLRLELWLAKSRSPFYQHYYEHLPNIDQNARLPDNNFLE